MSKKKRQTSPKPSTNSQKTAAKEKAKAKKNMARQSTIIFVITAVALVVVFAGRWVSAISNGYFDTFVQLGASLPNAMSNMRGLDLSEEEAAQRLVLEKEWDLYTSSRLCDEITVTAQDGISLHGWLYNEESTTTVIYIPRFGLDGRADFLPGTELAKLGCNLLLIDPRAHGKSEGEYFGYGVLEQQDLRCWLDWAENDLGSDRILIWGEATGANTALFADANGLLDDQVCLVVAESPYASLTTLAGRSMFHWYTVPAFPFLNAIEYKVNHGNTGYQVSDTDLSKALSGAQLETPVLFLESAGDDYVLNEWTKAVMDACGEESQLIRGGGTHGTVYTFEREEIAAALQPYLN